MLIENTNVVVPSLIRNFMENNGCKILNDVKGL